MANLIISYYAGVENGCASTPLRSETIVTSITSAQGAANTAGAAVASLFSDTAHYFTTGDNPTAAATNGAYLPASTLVWLDLNGLTGKIAAITA